ncbi:MAG TPA: DUF6119 family protein [Puia sp.]|jgi:uncharacterized protein (TIGR04141 family)
MPTRTAVCLYEDIIDKIEIADLLVGKPLTKIRLLQQDSSATLFLKESYSSAPEWTEIIRNFGDISGKDTSTASSGAILFLKIDKKILGFCFGSTVGNINKDNIVPDFGLATAFHRISKRDIKSIESYSLSTNLITNNRSSAIPTTQDNFNIDNYLENITELSGRFYSRAKRILIKGKEFYSTPSPISLSEIKELGKELLEDYSVSIKDEYYKRLTATRKIKDKKLVDFLNDELCGKMDKRSDEVSLIDYESLSNLSTYSLTPKGKRFLEISIENVYSNLIGGRKLRLLNLKTKNIQVFDESGTDLDSWPLYKCLFYNAKTNVGSYILYKGNWYEIQERYIKDLRNFIKDYEIDSKVYSLPNWDGVQSEEDYNISTSTSIGGQCWDRILYIRPDFSYGIEFCDILTTNEIFHVKKSTRSSLSSHLLLQTAVSANLLHFDSGIRKWIKETSKFGFKKNLILNSKGELKNPNITYVILLLTTSKKKLSDQLPFFSLITFNLIIRKVTQLGFQVRICKA